VDQNSNLSVEYGITNIPAVLFIKNGEVIDKLVGANTSSTYEKKIEAYL
jgi:thioredoxin 1